MIAFFNVFLLYLLIPTVAAALLGVALVFSLRRERSSARLLQAMAGKLERLDLQFARFAPDEVVERMTTDAEIYHPERRQVTVMFADLRGFTRLCGELDPMVIVSILNGYFAQMSEVVARHHGTITELVGDGLLALFGALAPNPWQARDAVLAALDMRTELARYNRQLHSQGLPKLRFGIGIHCGELVAGVFGTDRLKKFGVVGDTINVASRVEGLTREFDVDLLITEEVRRKLGERFVLRAMPEAALKGKTDLVVTYHVAGPASASAQDQAAAQR